MSDARRAVIIAYKRVQGHGRVTRIATTLADTGRDVTIVGLRSSAKEELEEFTVNPHVRGVGFSIFRFRLFVLQHALRALDALQGWVDVLRWRR